MKQGSILAFLQPRVVSKAHDSGLVEVQITETEHAEKDIDIAGSSPSSSPVPQKVDDGQVKILEDPRACIVPFSALYIDKLKGITSTLFPVRYSDKFFTECLRPENSFAVAFVAMYDAKAVGWIRCRYEPFPNKDNQVHQQLYIQVIGILAPFRGLGLAKALLDMVMNEARASSLDVHSVYAHVWERNEDALSWYQRQGFSPIMLQPHYYRKLKPAGAWIVRRDVT